MTEHAVVIVGAGPTGMMLAGELALAGVDVAVIERRTSRHLTGSRAGGLLSRTIEILDQRGIADRFVSEGHTYQVTGFAWMQLDFSDAPTRHNYTLGLKQKHIERILADWIDELGVPVYRAAEVTSFVQNDKSVSVQLSDGSVFNTEYLVGCDGGRSAIRKTAGIEFTGWDPTTSCLIAEVEFAEEPPWGRHRDAFGLHAFSKTEDGPTGVLVTERQILRGSEPTLNDLSEALIAVYGTDYGVHTPTSISRFTDAARQAASYRNKRVLLAGDAAHVHSPVGGQGLNTGIQDAVNLGWKLAQVVNGISPETLLDTYHAERHPVAARVLKNTLAQTALLRPKDDRTDALRDTVSELLGMEEPRKHFGAMMTGLDIRYDLGEGHPLLGRRMPDLDILTNDGSIRLFTLLHGARPVLLNLGISGDIDVSGWTERVQLIDAKHNGEMELPALGSVAVPDAILIRPDGYVAWTGNRAQAGLADALTKWFGPKAGRS